MMHRREFLGSAAMLAAGAVAGIKSKVKTHGPVDLKFDFFGPLTLRCMLGADPDKDRFNIRIMTRYVPEIQAEAKLSSIREAVSGGSHFEIRTWSPEGEEIFAVVASPKGGDLNFINKKEGSSFRLCLEDVRRVL